MFECDFSAIWTNIARHHHHFQVTDSTNTQLLQSISAGVLDHQQSHLYTAAMQSAGRGQHGRSWVSGQGNVFLSLYVPMRAESLMGFGLDHLSGLLSLTVGYCLAKMPIITELNHACQRHNLSPIGVKWANDIGYYDDSCQLFQKLAGILIEPVYKTVDAKHCLVGVVVGVGLNVQSSPAIKDGLYQATSLADIAAHIEDLDDQYQPNALPSAMQLYQPMTMAICDAVELHNRLSDTHTLDRFIQAFNQAHVLTAKSVNVYLRDDMKTVSQSGRCIGIDYDGALLLESAGSIERVLAGMIQSD